MSLWERAQVQEMLRRRVMSMATLVSRAGPAVTQPPIDEKYALSSGRPPLKKFPKGPNLGEPSS